MYYMPITEKSRQFFLDTDNVMRTFPAYESNQGLLHCRQALYHLNYQEAHRSCKTAKQTRSWHSYCPTLTLSIKFTNKWKMYNTVWICYLCGETVEQKQRSVVWWSVGRQTCPGGGSRCCDASQLPAAGQMTHSSAAGFGVAGSLLSPSAGIAFSQRKSP